MFVENLHGAAILLEIVHTRSFFHDLEIGPLEIPDHPCQCDIQVCIGEGHLFDV